MMTMVMEVVASSGKPVMVRALMEGGELKIYYRLTPPTPRMVRDGEHLARIFMSMKQDLHSTLSGSGPSELHALTSDCEGTMGIVIEDDGSFDT